ncbi:MAG: FecR family protein, partial [Elusimicrobia bacterium]|nr:FecR family protein [Candidatus Obscuribacterium magneticum]
MKLKIDNAIRGIFCAAVLFVFIVSLSRAAEQTTPSQTTPPAVRQPASPQKGARSKAAKKRARVKEPSAVLESFRNKVDVQTSGATDWKTAKDKTKLNQADRIRTGSRATARVGLEDGSKILLMQNSQAELENLSSVQRAIKLLRGRIRAIVKRLQGPGAFKVKTPIGV